MLRAIFTVFPRTSKRWKVARDTAAITKTLLTPSTPIPLTECWRFENEGVHLKWLREIGLNPTTDFHTLFSWRYFYSINRTLDFTSNHLQYPQFVTDVLEMVLFIFNISISHPSRMGSVSIILDWMWSCSTWNYSGQDSCLSSSYTQTETKSFTRPSMPSTFAEAWFTQFLFAFYRRWFSS